MELSKNISINKHVIQLIKGKQSLYGPIYILNTLKLETLQAYIKIHLKTRFIRPSKSPASILIFFDKKLNISLCLCCNYQGFKDFTIKNPYLLILISKSFYQFGQAKLFILLDFTSTFH